MQKWITNDQIHHKIFTSHYKSQQTMDMQMIQILIFMSNQYTKKQYDKLIMTPKSLIPILYYVIVMTKIHGHIYCQ